MAELPHYGYKSKIYPPAPSSEPPHCTCYNNPAITRQQCPRCTNRPNTNIRWTPPPPGSGNLYPGNTGFAPSAPFPPNSPVYHSSHRPMPPNVRPPPYQPPTCPTCSSCSCNGHNTNEYRPRPVISPPRTGPSIGGTKAYYWVDTFARGGVPTTALHGGHDIDGSQIFVGRAFHEGDWLPAKVIPAKSVAYVAYNGSEHAKDHYQVLCEQRFDWVPTSGGQVPPGAVEGGKTSDGETLYIGRVHHDGALTVGKVHPSHGVCYIPFDGRETGYDSYEILVLRS